MSEPTFQTVKVVLYVTVDTARLAEDESADSLTKAEVRDLVKDRVWDLAFTAVSPSDEGGCTFADVTLGN